MPSTALELNLWWRSDPAAAILVDPTLILDEFAGADGTNLVGRAPAPINTPGNAWAASGGTWQISSNRATKPTSSPNAYDRLTVDAEDANVRISASIGNSELHGLTIRVNAANTSGLTLRRTGSNLQLFSFTLGSNYVLIGSTATAAPPNPMNMSLEANGTTVIATGHDGTELEVESSVNQTEARHGLWGHTGGVVTWDDVVVEAL